MGGTVKVYSEVLGREVDVPEEPRRIVSLSPALTETLFLLDLGDRVVGVSYYCNKPPEARSKPRVGSYWSVSYSKLDELKPDLVLVTTGAQRKILEELTSRYTVYPVPLPVSVSGVIDQVVQVGIVTGALEEARRLEAELLSAVERLRGTLQGVKAYYEVFLGGPVSFGGHTYLADLFHLMGAATPFQRDRTTWVIDPPIERIKEFDPEVVIYEPSPYAKVKPEEELAKRGLGALRALREGKLVVLEPDSLAHYGPSLLTSIAPGVAEKVRRVLGAG